VALSVALIPIVGAEIPEKIGLSVTLLCTCDAVA
jgi:hypothetical protein